MFKLRAANLKVRERNVEGLACGRAGHDRRERLRDEIVEERHENAAQKRKRESFSNRLLRRVRVGVRGVPLLIGERAQDNRDRDESDAQKQKRRVPGRGRRRQKVPDHAQNERQPNSDGKRYGHPRDIDRGYEQNVRDIEDDASRERPAQRRRGRLTEVRDKVATNLPLRTHRVRENERRQQNAEHVIPVEEFITPFLIDEFLSVGPGTPAEHRDDAENDRQNVSRTQIHNSLQSFRGSKQRRTERPTPCFRSYIESSR